MRKFIGLFLVSLLVVGVAGLIGCGGKTRTVTVEEDGRKKETTVTTKVSEEDIGIPVYPGAKMDENAAGTVKTKGEKGETVYSAAVMWTDDSVAEVTEWYRKKLSGEPGFQDMSVSAAGQEVGLFYFMSGDALKIVTIGKDQVDRPGKTTIAVSSASGAEVPPSMPKIPELPK